MLVNYTLRKRPRRSHEDLDPEEKRQRFLERNRAAATRCREKKKIWINDLDKKVKDLSEKNVQLQVLETAINMKFPPLLTSMLTCN